MESIIGMPNFKPGIYGIVLLMLLDASQHAFAFDIVGPADSAYFGAQVKVLPNGNIVVTDPGFVPQGGQYSVGAVYLYSSSGALISKLTGSIPLDDAGSGGVHVVGDGNFVVCSPDWRNNNVNQHVGAVTWVNGVTGLNGQVSASNSLVGATQFDGVCLSGVVVLANGNYVVSSANWSSDTVQGAGAATWCDGNVGCSGLVSSANSLVGSSNADDVSSGDMNNGITALINGDYVVASPLWSNGGLSRVGAVTLCSGSAGCTGAVAPANSLIGSSTYDNVGSSTFAFYPAITPLTNGNFVVISQYWHDSASGHFGAVTWVNGHTGLIGAVSTNNSLVGSTAADLYTASVTALTNGNYVVSSPSWDLGSTVDVGAATWCSGTSGCIGAIGPGNSLVGSSAGDEVGFSPTTALTNGNYVVAVPYWSNLGVPKVGAATLCDGQVGCSGSVSAANSLIGTTAYDVVGIAGTTALANGSYVVSSPYWSNSSAGTSQVGAATWCNAGNGCLGEVTSTNSLTGSIDNDEAGYGVPGTTALTNGNYVVSSNHWQNGGASAVGAVTWGNGDVGLVGNVSVSNSLVGTSTDDSLGGPRVFATANGNYIVHSPSWQNGDAANAGAVSLMRGYGTQTGTISPSRSVQGTVANEGPLLSFDYDAKTDTLVVGKRSENIVTLLRIDQLFFNGFN